MIQPNNGFIMRFVKNKKEAAGYFQRLFLGDLSETRTPDTLIKSQVLYRLS